MAKKLDRRVRRTRRLLSEALFALIQEQEYDAITIQAITDRADLNRATFYLHYGSKDELMVDSLERMFDDLVAGFDELSPENPIWEDTTPVLRTFEHVADHADLYKVLLSERGTGYIVHRIINYITEQSEEQLRDSLPPSTPLPISSMLVCRHVAGSLFALLSWWITNDMPYSPAYMAEMVKRLCVEGTVAVVEGETAVVGY